MYITKEYLRSHPNEVFVFGDNTLHRGKGGAAALRDEPNTYGFITKKYPSHENEAFYTPEEYMDIFISECNKLAEFVCKNTDKTFLVSRLGAGLANRFGIYEKVIEPYLDSRLGIFPNIVFLED